MRNVLCVLTVLLLMLVGGGVFAQDEETSTPQTVFAILISPTPPPATEGPSPTPTETPTVTPRFSVEATVEVDGIGQDVAFDYRVSAGEFAIILMLAFVAVLLLFVLVLLAVKR